MIQADLEKMQASLKRISQGGGLSRDEVVALINEMVTQNIKERMSHQLRDFESLLIWSR